MFASVKRFLSDLADGGADERHFEENDYRLAAAALLVHAAAIDGNVSEAEHDRIRAVIAQRFQLDAHSVDDLVKEATEAEHEAVDLYRFTSLLNRSLNAAGRRRIVEMMWDIVYADDKVSELEDNLLWRAADLLGVSTRERLELRRRVRGQ